MERIMVRPRDGLMVRNADKPGMPPIAEGEKVALTPYIRRRLRAGDLIRVDAANVKQED